MSHTLWDLDLWKLQLLTWPDWLTVCFLGIGQRTYLGPCRCNSDNRMAEQKLPRNLNIQAPGLHTGDADFEQGP